MGLAHTEQPVLNPVELTRESHWEAECERKQVSWTVVSPGKILLQLPTVLGWKQALSSQPTDLHCTTCTSPLADCALGTQAFFQSISSQGLCMCLALGQEHSLVALGLARPSYPLGLDSNALLKDAGLDI